MGENQRYAVGWQKVTARIFVALVALIITAGAYAKGRTDSEARHTAAALQAERAAAETLAALAATEEANRILARALEDQAYAEPPSVACGLPRSRVLRLRER